MVARFQIFKLQTHETLSSEINCHHHKLALAKFHCSEERSMGEHTETPNLSRWQQLYGSASINEKSRNELSIQKIQESFEDSESVNEWFDDLNFKLKDQDDLVFEIKNPIQLVSSKDEDEAEKILDDLEDMIREHDYDLMESILESDRHQQAIAQFRNEENARNCLRQWKNYTKGRIVKLQFAASVIQDKRFHYIKSKSFNKWLESLRESSAFTNDFKQLQQQKLLRNILRVWAEEIKQQVKASQVRKLLYQHIIYFSTIQFKTESVMLLCLIAD